MPQFFTTFIGSLRVVYDAQESGDLYDYSQLALQDDVQDDAQLAVQWLCNSVVRVSDGVTIFPALDLSTREAEIIYTLDSSLYTVNSTAKTVEILNADVENSLVEANGVEYRRGPLTANVSADYPIVIARSTDISEPIISYLPGSRLSHTTLNASNDQLIFALQELQLDLLDIQTETGVVDISNAALGEMGDVTLTGLAGDTEYLVFVPGSGWINQTAAELDIASAATVDALDGTNLERINGGGIFIDTALTSLESDITGLDNTKVNYTDSIGTLGDVDVTGIASGDFFRYDGANWVPVTPYFDDIQVSSSDPTTLTTVIGDIAVDIVSLDGAKVEYSDSIDALADVDTTTASPSIGNVLEWDGSNWVPAVPSASPIQSYVAYSLGNPVGGNLTTGSYDLFSTSTDFGTLTTAYDVQSSDNFFTSNLTEATGEWTAPAGVYRVEASLALVDNQVGDLRIRCKKNGSDYGSPGRVEVKSTDGDQWVQMSWLVESNGSDVIRVAAEHVAGTCNITGAAFNITQVLT
jgi:hypothetical protein